MIFPCRIVTSRLVFQRRSPRSFCTGVVQARRPLGNRDGTKQLYGIRPMHVPMQRRLPLFSLQGVLENQRPRNLSVPHAGQANRRARSPQGSAAIVGSIPAESRPRRTRDRQRKRIGSVSRRLCTWAASAGPVTFEKPRSPARRPIQSDEVEPSPQRSRGGITSRILTSRLRSPVLPQFGVQLATPGRGWFNWCS